MRFWKFFVVAAMFMASFSLMANPQTLVNVLHSGQIGMALSPEYNVDAEEFTFFGKFLYGFGRSTYMDLDFGFADEMYFGANFTQRFAMSSRTKFFLQGGAHHDGEMALDGNGIFAFTLNRSSLMPFAGLNLDVYLIDGSIETQTLLPLGVLYILQREASIQAEFQLPLNTEAPSRFSLGFLYKF